MPDTARRDPLPSLPQGDDDAERRERAYQLSLARTAYNYPTSYLSPAPLCAEVPSDEKCSLAYEAKVAPVLIEVADNLRRVLMARFEAELKSDLPELPMPWMVDLEKALEAAEKQLSGASALNPIKDLEALRAVMTALREAPAQVGESFAKLSEIPQHLQGLEKSITTALADMKEIGVTSVLRDTLYEQLRTQATGDAYLHATTIEDFATLYPGLPAVPRVMTLKPQDWPTRSPAPTAPPSRGWRAWCA
jgi:arachidonate 15-lipoxygenase